MCTIKPEMMFGAMIFCCFPEKIILKLMYFQEKKKQQTKKINYIKEDKEQLAGYWSNFLFINKAKTICVSCGIC